MPTPIAPISAAPALAEPAKLSGSKAEAAQVKFGSIFETAVQRLEKMRGDADQAVQNLLTGEGGELHTVALAAQRAEIAFDLGLQIRNKIVSAYQEVMRMQL